MVGIESSKIGIYNFDYFSVDMTMNGSFYMGGSRYTLCQASCDILNLSNEYITELLRLCGELNVIRTDLLLRGGYDHELFVKVREQIRTIINLIKLDKPFCWFNTEYSLQMVEEIFSENNLNEFDVLKNGQINNLTPEGEMRIKKISENFKYANALITVYCYFGVDVANYGTMLINFIERLMQNGNRRPADLAAAAYHFFNDKEMQQKLTEATPFKDFEGVTLRPRVTQVPVIAMNADETEPIIARRLYFGRLMDFFITELFEGLMHGHYLWRCGVCEKYFLMTTAHHQLYCKQFNKKYDTTCDHVANNRRLAKNKGLSRQSKKVNPLWILRNKRNASIRKNKSLGKYSEAISAEAKAILDEFYYRAETDAEYADSQYVTDIQLKNLYRLAIDNLN